MFAFVLQEILMNKYEDCPDLSKLCSCTVMCSNLCLQGQLVGYRDLSQLQGQVKLVFWVSGHSQSLLSEALHNTRKHTKKLL